MPIILNGTTGITTPGITNTGPFVFEGAITVPQGTASTAAISVTGCLNTGIYFPTTSSVALTTAGTQRIVISSSGDVGIGTASPSYKLDVSGTGNFGGANPTLYIQPTTTTNNALLRCVNAGGTGYIGLDNNVPGLTENYALNIYHSGAYPINFSTNGTLRATIDSSGNLGLGVTPSAWDTSTSIRAIQLGGGSVYSYNNDRIFLGQNVYFKATTTDAYVGNGKATSYRQYDGLHAWYTAVSGTAGNAITFTQAMTLNDSVQLGIGTTSPAYPLQVRRAGGACSLGLTMDNYGAIAELARSVFYYAIGDQTTDKTGHLFFTRDATATDNLRMVINSSGNVGIGTSSPASKLTVSGSVQVDAGRIGYSPDGDTFSYNSGTYANYGLTINTSLIGLSGYYGLAFFTGGAERGRFTDGGQFVVGNTATGTIGSNVPGVGLSPAGYVMAQTGSEVPIYVNRNTDDGTLVGFYQAAALEGTISVSGSTVSYNGGHLSRWSQTTDNTRIPLLKGTVMSNLDQMANWGGQENEQLNCMKVSDIDGDINVAGVFVNWDNDDDEFTNDMNIAMTGDMIIRIAQGVVVQRGDLLMSAGDGTAKPQGDDIIRSKTVAKVTSNHVTCTYEDGSYCVPCVLMAC